MTIKAKPFIKWVGGKTQLIESIEKALPENFAEFKNVTYIEPFVELNPPQADSFIQNYILYFSHTNTFRVY